MTTDHTALEEMLRSFLPDASRVHVEQVVPLTGGFSAETARVQATCETGEGSQSLDLVLRQAPADGVLAPYDLEREARILRALQNSSIPVPSVVGCDSAGEFLGRQCLVTEFVSGVPLGFFGRLIESDEAPRLPAYFATLAAIHAIDWDGLGLDFLDGPGGPVDLEFERCQARQEYHGGPDAREREMLAWLTRAMPADGQKSLLHGDPNPANYIFAGTQVAAVLDWELAGLGDPRLDLGFYAAAQSVFGGLWRLDTAAYIRGYAAANPSANLDHLDYFEAVGLYRFSTFLRTAGRRGGIDATELQQRLSQRFERIASR